MIRSKRAAAIILVSVSGCAVVFLWLFGGLQSVRIKPATHAQILAAVDPRVRYLESPLPTERNAWVRVEALFNLPSHERVSNFVPPLSPRAVVKVRPFVDEWRWVDPELDKLLAGASAQAPSRYGFADSPRWPPLGGPFGLAGTYLSMRLAVAQAVGPKSEVWPCLRRVLQYARMMANLEGNHRAYRDAQEFWIWPDNIRVGLADPSLSADQLREALRILPEDKDVIAAEQRTARIDFAELVLPAVETRKLAEVTRYSPDPKLSQHYVCGELDVAKAVTTLSALTAAWMEAIAKPRPEARAAFSAALRSLMPQLPEYPWPEPRESWLSQTWRQAVYRFKIRQIPNSMIRYLPMSVGATDLDAVFDLRAEVDMARIFAAIQLYRKLHGVFPANLQTLVSTGLIAEALKDPTTGRDFGYDGRVLWHGSSLKAPISRGVLGQVWDLTTAPRK